MVQQLELTQGLFAQVDDHVFETLQGRWHATRSREKFYAARSMPWTIDTRGRKVRPKLYLHRYVTGCHDPQLIVDHYDGDGLNCTEANLIVCGYAWNNHNVRRNLASGYRGVYRHHSTGTWEVKFRHKGENLWLGTFKDEIEAARAYDETIVELYGRWAMTNVREGRLPPLDPVAILNNFPISTTKIEAEVPF